MISRRVVPIGISTRPVLFILPPTAKTLVPFDFSVPMFANHSAPLSSIIGIFAYVSTLFSIVGCPNRPLTAGKGGLGLGSPRCPSTEVMSAVSSPHTKAPAPSLTSRLKSKPVPNMSLPSSPYSLAWFIAIVSLSTAIGYSALT